MDHDATTPYLLPPGVTGFHGGGDAAPPDTGPATCRTAWYAAARAAPGRVEAFTPSAYPRSFHTAAVRFRDAVHVALFQTYYPLVAFVDGHHDWYTDEFVDPPPWAATLTRHGFTVLDAVLLRSPAGAADTSALTPAELHQIKTWRPDTVGEILFNSWD